jgi:putative transposase
MMRSLSVVCPSFNPVLYGKLMKLEVVKTVRVPVHYALTKRKLSILDRLTARHSYCIWLFSKSIEERRMSVEGYGGFTKGDVHRIAKLTKLSSPFIQQCRDRALWMSRSYRAQHEDWERRLKHAKGKWREKLLQREPEKPFHNSLARKVPVRIDSRTGVVEASRRMKLSPYVLRLSTLRKRSRITIPLNPSDYHIELLKEARIGDFQLVKRNDRYYAHICVKYAVRDVPVRAVRGIDLGVRRAIATVLLKPNQRLRREDLSILRDIEKKHRLHMLNRRAAELQQIRKWEPLKRIRHKRRAVAEYYDRLDAIRIANLAKQESSMVAVGYPKGVKYEKYRGNREQRLRRMLQQRFPYRRRIRYIVEECTERGVTAEPIVEAWTSRRCHRCGSVNTRRPRQSLFWCLDCGAQYNADWNSAINIGSVLFATRLSGQATEGLAHAGDELAYKPASPEVRSEALTQARQQL